MEPGDGFSAFETNDEELKKAFWGDPDDATSKSSTDGYGPPECAEPEPLTAPSDAEIPYPVDALPPILRDAIIEYARYGQQPIPLIATSALSCASLAAQGLADVARDAYLRGPISL